MQFNEKRMLDRLMEMIRIDSPSFHEKPMTDYPVSYTHLDVYKRQGLDGGKYAHAGLESGPAECRGLGAVAAAGTAAGGLGDP